MDYGYGKDSTLNAELLNPRVQLVKCCACSLLCWGLRMYLSVLHIRSSSTDPGTITITNSATFTHSPNLSHTPKRVASPQNSLAERGAGGGGAVLLLAHYQTHRCCLLQQGLLWCCCLPLLPCSPFSNGGVWGGRLWWRRGRGGRLHLTFHCPPLVCAGAVPQGLDAASLVPIPFVHPPITQPVLALGLSLMGWMLKPLSLELVCGPLGP